VTERPYGHLVSDGVHGGRTEPARPLPNKADAAWEELEALRAEARDLGIQVDGRWPIIRLREEIDAVKGAHG